MKKEEFYAHIPKAELGRLTKEHRLPAFFYFRKIIEQKHRDLAGCLPERFRVHYAFKANPNGNVIQCMRSLGMGGDVASLGELIAAKEAGFPPEDIEFTGPGKTQQELSLAIQAGIGSINVESISEIKKIVNICRANKTTANIGVRVNPRQRPSSSAMKMGGDSQFGIAETELAETLGIIRAEPLLHFTGLHMHLGSQYQEAGKLLTNFRFILEKAYEIMEQYRMPLEKVNFGGGWGIDMFGRKPPLDLCAMQEGLSLVFDDPKYAGAFKNTKCIVEPGRFLSAECGVYATEVLYRKKNHQREFLIVDGGMHQHYAAAGGIGQVLRRNYEIDTLLNGKGNGQKTTFSIAGSLCLPDDVLATEIELDASIGEGDVVLFFNSGAYGLSASPANFLSHPLPGEIFVGN